MNREHQLWTRDEFHLRHIGPRPEQVEEMLKSVGVSSIEELIDQTVPSNILLKQALHLPAALDEYETLKALQQIAVKNSIFRSYIGMGFHDCVTPAVIQRNIFENPGWYTQYTPYQAEISQGRLEALINFQTMVSDLTGMEIANASLLDEGTAAGEAMTFCYRLRGSEEKNKFFISSDCHPPTLQVVQTRARPLGIQVVIGKNESIDLDTSFFGALLQYPTTDGFIRDDSSFCGHAHKQEALVVVATDLLALTLLRPPGEWGADVVIGNSQRFGVPLGFGGPHAAFFSTKAEFKRQMPGRLVGVSKDTMGADAFRLALQTREQHIRREKATSNICTAQVLLAVMAGMYAVYHGPEGLRKIAKRIHNLAVSLYSSLKQVGISCRHSAFFDTITVEIPQRGARHFSMQEIQNRAKEKRINFLMSSDRSLGISLDETTSPADLIDILEVITGKASRDVRLTEGITENTSHVPQELIRQTHFLSHSVFQRYHSETELLRYIKRLEAKDLSLTTSMIPLGSCTMKLNAAAELLPVTWPEFGKIHPFVPREQVMGYEILCNDLEQAFMEVTGLAAVALQPNAGSQGEYTGLLVIRAYHEDRGEGQRDVVLIPQSAHGTNPATAMMLGMRVVPVGCDEFGNIDLVDLQGKAKEEEENLAALMVTYPSTHGVFEESIRKICEIVHTHRGQVYMDGANMNAQVGLCRPGDFGVDVCHLNLHKTFCIPHGGGGPGVGPIAVQKHLVQYLPRHSSLELNEEISRASKKTQNEKAVGPVTSAPWGSASILTIPWVYIKMMGASGLRKATEVAILNANYLAKKLNDYYPVLYRGKHGMVAHECIFDLREVKKNTGIEVEDVAKRLADYGFHAPTVSFPVPGTLMVEPTESESKDELDRFCEAMIAIRKEIQEIETGKADKTNNVLKNAPHTALTLVSDSWDLPYSREKAAYPLPWLKVHKYWPPVGRIDNVYGDRFLFCSCVPLP